MELCVIFLLVVVTLTHADENDILERWTHFRDTFGKVYKSQFETQKRFEVFKKNLQNIESHNILFEEGEVSYSLGTNKFADWTSDEFQQYVNRGLVRRPKPVPRRNYSENPKKIDLPESVDWRKEGLVTGVKDQGECGSCWSFSVTGTLEGQFAKKNGTLVSLSEQNLIDCSFNDGCNGGMISTAYIYIWETGVESEEDYPYVGVRKSCKAEPEKIVTKMYTYEDIDEDDEESLIEALASVGPVSVVIDATKYLQLYSSGIFDDKTCGSEHLNHAVLAVGYGKENGQEYYIVKNNWGADWGEDGYFRLLKDNNRCGIAATASYPVLK